MECVFPGKDIADLELLEIITILIHDTKQSALIIFASSHWKTMNGYTESTKKSAKNRIVPLNDADREFRNS